MVMPSTPPNVGQPTREARNGREDPDQVEPAVVHRRPGARLPRHGGGPADIQGADPLAHRARTAPGRGRPAADARARQPGLRACRARRSGRRPRLTVADDRTTLMTTVTSKE